MTTAQLAQLRANQNNLEAIGDKVVDAIAEGAPATAQTVAPAAADGTGNTILPTSKCVAVAANTTDVNDWIVLPLLSTVPVGHTVTVVSNAAGHEVRTPASSNEKINNQDSDGTKEYAIASGSQVHRFTKISDSIGWVGYGVTALGAVVTAVVPD